MIINIEQTASNTKQLFDVESDDFYYSGSAGSLSELQTVTLSGKEDVLKAVFSPTDLKKCFPNGKAPFKALFINPYMIYKNENSYGSMVYAVQGLFKKLYLLTAESGELIHCYYLANGSFKYVSFYLDNVQIALIETYLFSRDRKYRHKLYLLDEYANFADLLSLFAVCYSSSRFSKRFHMSSGSGMEREWTITSYRKKYDPHWRETNFPNENYFGRILDSKTNGK